MKARVERQAGRSMDRMEIDRGKLWATLLTGWLTLIMCRHPMILDTIYKTRFPWYMLFPILIISAWGERYIWILGLGGGFFFQPIFEQPQRGVAALLYIFLNMALLFLCGKIHKWRLKDLGYYGMFLGFGILYYLSSEWGYIPLLSLNPVGAGYALSASPMISRIQTITVVMGVIGLASLSRVLLKLPIVRKMFGLPELSYSQNNTKIFCTVIMVTGLYLVVDGMFESFYFQSRGIHTFLLFNTFGGLSRFPLVFTVVCVICDSLILNFMRVQESHEKLAHSEERYRMMFTHMSDAYLEIDEQGTILNHNPAAGAIGFVSRCSNGKPIDALFVNCDRIDAMIRTLFEKNSVENVEMEVELIDCARSELLVSGNVMHVDGQRIGALTIRDITGYKRMEEKRWELSALLNAIFESNQDFIWTVDAGQFTLGSFNQAFEEYAHSILGKNVKDGSRMTEIFPEEDGMQFERYYQMVLDQGDRSVEYATPDGRILDMSLYPVKLNGAVTSIIVFCKDISARKRAERKIIELNSGLEQTIEARTLSLREAYHDLESFSYVMTHELKTPIREIYTYLEIIQEDNLQVLNEQAKEDIAAAQKVCMQTLDMIEKMMIYTRAGFMTLDIERVDMDQLVQECLEDIRKADLDRRIEAHVSELPYLYVDRFLIRIAVMNILSNSIKFSKNREKTVIKIWCEKTDEYFTYYFKDNGVGFVKKETNDLLGLFNRAHNSDEYDGSGIGLALVARIVSRHGGSARIDGEEGKGCTVCFRFPRNNQTIRRAADVPLR